MKLTDVHTHQCPPGNVAGIINLMNPDQVSKALAQPGLYSAGVHPWHIHPDHWQEDVKLIRENIRHPNLIAIGEAGLDRLVDLPVSLQEDVFRAMVELSEEAGKPLIIHAVRTHAEVLLIRRELRPTQPWIIHGFNLKQSIADALLNSGCLLSFGAALLHANSAASRVFPSVPEELFFLETDDSNTDIKEIYQRTALLRDCTIDQLTASIYERFNATFIKP